MTADNKQKRVHPPPITRRTSARVMDAPTARRIGALLITALWLLLTSPALAQHYSTGLGYGVEHRFHHLRVFSAPHHLHHSPTPDSFRTGRAIGHFPRYYNLATPGPFVIHGTTGYLPYDYNDSDSYAPRRAPDYAYHHSPPKRDLTRAPADAGGWAFLSAGRYDEARARFDIAAQQPAYEMRAKLGALVTDAAQNKTQNATAALQAILKNDPAALDRLTLTRSQKNQLATIASHLTDNANAQPPRNTALLRATLYYLADQTDEARAALNDLTDDTPASDNLKKRINPTANPQR